MIIVILRNGYIVSSGLPRSRRVTARMGVSNAYENEQPPAAAATQGARLTIAALPGRISALLSSRVPGARLSQHP